MTKELALSIVRDSGEGDREFDVTVTYEASAGSRGSRGPHGEQMEPDEEPSVEILSVKDEDGTEIELTDAETEEVNEMVSDADASDAESAAEDRAERDRDERDWEEREKH